MRVPDEVRQCVVFLGQSQVDADGNEGLYLRGTAFFVHVPSESLENWGYTYLVTARHVAERLVGGEFFIRVNDTSGGSELVWSGGVRWWTHPFDPIVDVAAFPWSPPREHVEYKTVPSRMFVNDEIIADNNIGIGDEVFMTGLFAHMTGSRRNLPILRMGNIAMMPPEPVPTREGLMDAYLIEARSLGGVSGSPAFVRQTAPVGIGSFHLLGLMHGHWDIPVEAKNDHLSGGSDLLGSVNMGIAIVVPAAKILQVLNHTGLVAMRTASDAEEAARRAQAPVPAEDAVSR